MDNIPPDVLDVVREFLAEGMPHAQIAFMVRVSESVVRDIAAGEQAKAVDLSAQCDSFKA